MRFSQKCTSCDRNYNINRFDDFQRILLRLTAILTKSIRENKYLKSYFCCKVYYVAVQTADKTDMPIVEGKCNYSVNKVSVIKKIACQRCKITNLFF